MIGKFGLNNPFNAFLLFIYGLLLKLVWFIHPQIPNLLSTDGFFYNGILSFIKPFLDRYPVIYPLLAFLLLYTQAINLNQIMNNRRLMQKSNYLPGMTYILITSFFPDWNILSSALIINTLLIWLWARLSSLYNNQKAKATLYNTGLMVGLASFFYFPALVFSFLIIISLILVRPFRIQEWFITFLGILTPWYLLIAWLFLSNKLYSYSLPRIKANYTFFIQDRFQYIGMLAIFFTALLGGLFVQITRRKQLVQVRKNWTLLLFYLIIALLIPFINSIHNFQYWILTAVPFSAFIAFFFFYPTKKWFPLSIHWLMVGFVIYMSYLKK